MGLAGQPNGVVFGMYGGYVTIDDHNSRALYYWFQETDVGGRAARPLAQRRARVLLHQPGRHAGARHAWNRGS